LAPSSHPSLTFALNGETQVAHAPLCLTELLERFGLHGQRVAVAINAAVIPRSRFREIQIQPGDRVEVIHAVGGG